ncbi:hypothetical protein B0T11DRAFT_99955 [Plectosphaerella cucumerina]|uniref:Mitochondrial pyruvate carrier n=1 Tax=Plectosphaerella cucumerina TaxID=40658 RepID=A0A8K0TAP5_9PEZI|nr:hypothetical protein B0T11DRAFT_99955 [Plectosphaerella cucumerina]
MASTASFLRASRPVFQQQMFSGAAAGARTRAAFQNPSFRAQFFRQQSKRWQSSSSSTAEPQVSWFKRMWDSPIGLKTVHFWAPVMKWSIVLAGISDFFRPAENLSVTQNFALTCTGLIWTRWCLIIKPRNILLATVNFFMGCVGVIQLTRIAMLPKSTDAAVEDIKEDVKETVPNPISASTSS